MRNEQFFPFVEQEGVDRRHAILEITTNADDCGYHGEVFDTVTGQTLWLGPSEFSEDVAYESAELVLDMMERRRGFGSISLTRGGCGA